MNREPVPIAFAKSIFPRRSETVYCNVLCNEYWQTPGQNIGDGDNPKQTFPI